MEDAVEAILLEIVDARHREYGVYLETLAQVEAVATQHPDGIGMLPPLESIAFVMTQRATIDARRSAVRISSMAARLDEAALLRLVRASDEVYTDYLAGNLAHVDALALHTEAFDYIPEPTPAVRQAHAEHLARLDAGECQDEVPNGNKASH